MKTLIYYATIIGMPICLTGCAATKWLIDNEEAAKAAGDTAQNVGGPAGYILSGALGLAVAGAKWYEQKGTTKDIVEAVQKSKDELPAEAKQLMRDLLNAHMPSKAKKVIKTIKKK